MTDAELLKRVDAFARKHKKNELIEMCRKKNLSPTGSKHDLAKRIHGVVDPPSMARLAFQRPVVLIQRTREGFYVHEPTGLVFDRMTKRVTGRLESVYTGEEDHDERQQRVVVPLRRQDLQLCQQYKFRAVMPVFLEDSFKEGRDTWYNQDHDVDEEDQESDEDEFL